MSEPTTLLTDYLLATLSLVLALKLMRPGLLPSVARRLWAGSFLALMVAAVVGGTWHGLGPAGLPWLRHDLWSITYTAIGLTDLLLLAGAACALPPGPRVVALALLMGRFLVYAALILDLRDVRYVAYDYGVTLLLLFAFGLDLLRRRERAAGFVLAGALVSFAGGLVQALHLSPHPQFNGNDLFHVIQMVGIWLFFRAGLLLPDEAVPLRPSVIRVNV
jgi:hypothetical protein